MMTEFSFLGELSLLRHLKKKKTPTKLDDSMRTMDLIRKSEMVVKKGHSCAVGRHWKYAKIRKCRYFFCVCTIYK